MRNTIRDRTLMKGNKKKNADFYIVVRGGRRKYITKKYKKFTGNNKHND